MSFVLPFTTPPSTEVFAVEDTCAQLIWRRLPAGVLSAVVHHHGGTTELDLGPAEGAGAAEITGFEPDTTTSIDLLLDGRPVAHHTVTTTATIDHGPVTRIATISDLHLGEEGFGLVRELKEPRDVVPYPLRCALAAVREAEAWGAELLVIKGDITEEGRAAEWELFDALLAGISIPVVAVPGNHDTVGKAESVDATVELQRRGLFPAPVHTADLDGVRVVLADSTIPTRSRGRLGHHREALIDAVAVDRPAVVLAHHHLQQRAYPTFWPLGVDRGDRGDLVTALAEANPDLLISSGHSHRTRIRYEAGVPLTEVGSTKDFPGVWAGYAIHRGGVRQVVRRVAETSCLTWTDRTHAVVGGIWGRWSPGGPADRALVHHWPSRQGVDPTAAHAVQAVSSEVPSERV